MSKIVTSNGNAIPCYVINLRSARDRLTHIDRQFAAIKTQYHWIEAFDKNLVSDLTTNKMKSIGEKTVNKHPWSRGQIANLYSHRIVWNKINSSNAKFAAVFEDDVHISPELEALLESHSWIPKNMDIIRLETTLQGVRVDRSIGSVAAARLLPLRSEAWGSAGYIISREGASYLLDLPEDFLEPTDWLLFHPRSIVKTQLSVCQTDPAFCIQDQYHPNVTIRRDFAKETSISPKARGVYYLWLQRLIRLIIRRRVIPFAGNIDGL